MLWASLTFVKFTSLMSTYSPCRALVLYVLSLGEVLLCQQTYIAEIFHSCNSGQSWPLDRSKNGTSGYIPPKLSFSECRRLSRKDQCPVKEVSRVAILSTS
ncbi:hypothetical protein F5Y06DRAFT_279099 [Hypoxylon sp. FL0890]|nr:hypothetical protein F5Y06DRAFT_279099 [Hypoxylon sp. FL0890]